MFDILLVTLRDQLTNIANDGKWTWIEDVFLEKKGFSSTR